MGHTQEALLAQIERLNDLRRPGRFGPNTTQVRTTDGTVVPGNVVPGTDVRDVHGNEVPSHEVPGEFRGLSFNYNELFKAAENLLSALQFSGAIVVGNRRYEAELDKLPTRLRNWIIDGNPPNREMDGSAPVE